MKKNGYQKKILKSPIIKVLMRDKIFSTIIEANKRKKNNNFFNNDQIQNMLNTLQDQIIIKNDQDNVITEFLSNYKAHVENNQRNKQESLKKKIMFNNNFLLKIIENQENSLTIKEIKEEYKLIYPDSKFSDSTLRRHLINDLGFTFKKSAIFNKKAFGIESKLLNLTFINKFCDLLKDNHEILYLDESSFVNWFQIFLQILMKDHVLFYLFLFPFHDLLPLLRIRLPTQSRLFSLLFLFLLSILLLSYLVCLYVDVINVL